MPETPPADRLDDDDLAAVDLIADRIMAKLGQSVIASSFPAEIGERIRKAAHRNSIHWLHTIPLAGPDCIIQQWVMNPDGTVNVELRGSDNITFWRGTFRPAAP